MTTAAQEIRRFHRFTQLFEPLRDSESRRPSYLGFAGLSVSANLRESAKSVDDPLHSKGTTIGRLHPSMYWGITRYSEGVPVLGFAACNAFFGSGSQECVRKVADSPNFLHECPFLRRPVPLSSEEESDINGPDSLL